MTRMVSLAASLLMAIGVRCSSDGGTRPDDLACVDGDAGEAPCDEVCTPFNDSECGDPAAYSCGADGECHPR